MIFNKINYTKKLCIPSCLCSKDKEADLENQLHKRTGKVGFFVGKFLFLAAFVFFCFTLSISAEENIPEENIESHVSQPVVKDFIYQSLEPWVHQDITSHYEKVYGKQHKKVKVRPIKKDDIGIQMGEIQPGKGGKFTHIVRVKILNLKVKPEGEDEFFATDTLIYKVNINELSAENDVENVVKLLEYKHQER